MAQIQSIQALAESHAQEVSRSPRDWMGYLDTAARLYRYSFQENLLIHAQRPGATACAELELWNSKMNRWVNRGAKGIALLDDTGPRLRLRYVFDISDTHPVKGARDPYLWEMRETHRAAILSHLADAYGLDESADTLPLALMAIARQVSEENLEEAMKVWPMKKAVHSWRNWMKITFGSNSAICWNTASTIRSAAAAALTRWRNWRNPTSSP